MPPQSLKTEKGTASRRISHALAHLAPTRPTRNEVLDSDYLREAHQTPRGEKLSAAEKAAANKTIGRMIMNGTLKEVIVPNADENAINLPETGLVAVSVSLLEINKAFEIWKENGGIGESPNQAAIANDLRTQSSEWLKSNYNDRDLPLFVKDIWIVHGSTSFDMVIVVLYEESNIFLAYIREVVQRTWGVNGTQTMMITNNLSDEEIERLGK
ncbi:hypothetical protein N9491_06035 [Planktomarina temperata]|nr:hypothetical protein [Planktomarina temperata]